MTMSKAPAYDTICDALKALDARCNGAINEDGQGFNGGDSRFGKGLADYLRRGGQLTEEQQKAAIRMLQTYRNQLARLGIDLPRPTEYEIKPLPKLGPAPAGSTPAQKPMPAQPDQLIDALHGELIVAFPYNPTLVNAIKALPSKQRQWNQTSKRWHVHPAHSNAIAALLPDATITSAAQTIIAKYAGAPAPVAPPPPMPFTIKLENGELVLRFEYDPALVDKVKALPERKFDKALPGWRVPARRANEVIAMFESVAEIDANIMALVTQQDTAPTNSAPSINAISSLVPDLSASINGITLFAHQKEDIANMLTNGSLILAGEVGTGKTYTLLTAAKIVQEKYGWEILAITKASLKDDLRRSADRIGVSIQIYSWAKIPAPPDSPYVLIADEAHMSQGGKRTVRGQAFLDLAEHPNCKICWPATGTPMRNGKPINLYPLLKAVKAPVATNKRKYEEKFCGAKATRFTKWDISGVSNLTELYQETAPKIIRRKKIDCLDLPPQILTIRKVQLSSEAQKKYNTLFCQIEKEYFERKEAKRKELEEILGNDPDNLAVAQHLDNLDGADAISLLGRLRRANSYAKVEEAIELAEEILDQGSSVVISTEFLDTAEEIYRALKDYSAEMLTGSVTGNEAGQKISKRQAMIDRFQAKKSRVFVMTGSSGGTGVTLTSAQDMIVVDRPLVNDDVVQLHGRCHRITQTGTVNLHWLQAQEIDRKIDENLIGKDNNSAQVIDGKSVGDLAKDILRELFK